MSHSPATSRDRSRAGDAPRAAKASRPLMFEAMESRLVLSGTPLDLGTWNLDSIQDSYAVVSADQIAPLSPSATQSFVHAVDGDRDGLQLDFRPLFDGRGLFRSEFLAEHRPALDALRELVKSWPRSDVPEPATEAPALGPVDTVVGDATTGDFLRLPLKPPTNGPYVVLFDETDAVGPSRVEVPDALSDEMPAASGVAGSIAGNETGVAPAEGGEIPLERLVAAVGDVRTHRDGRLAPPPIDDAPLAARGAAPAHIAAELARAVAFETIDGQAPPLVYAAIESVVERPRLAASDAAAPVAAAAFVNQRTDDGSLANHLRPTPMLFEAPTPDELAAPLDDAPPASGHDAERSTGDSALLQAFAEWNADELGSDRDRLERDEKPHLWLAGLPILAALVTERLVAARRKAREADSRDPHRTKRSATICSHPLAGEPCSPDRRA